MAEERITLLTAREAAKYLRVSLYTLNKIEKQGQLVPFRTPGGHRRYSLEMLNEYLESSRFLYAPSGHQEPLTTAPEAAKSVSGDGLGSEGEEKPKEAPAEMPERELASAEAS